MKAKQRTLVVLLILVILAGGALALLTCSDQKAEQAASEAEEGSIQLSSFAVDDLTRIQYTYQGETVSLLYDGDTWTLEDDPEYHLDQNKCDTMATALADLRAKRQLEAQGDQDYGMDVPIVTVTVTAGAQTNTFTFGDTNSITGDIYLQKEGDSAVYTASSSKVGCFEYGKADLFGAFNPAGITSSSLETIDYTYFGGETPVSVSLKTVSVAADDASSDSSSTADSDSSSYSTAWRLADDPDVQLDEEKTNAILSALGGYVSGQITDADLAAYGFDQPLVTVDASDGNTAWHLTYACGTDGYYLMVQGDSSIYTVDATVPEAFSHTVEELKADS